MDEDAIEKKGIEDILPILRICASAQVKYLKRSFPLT